MRMFNDGLIYQDTKGVAWDCKMRTAISNIEITNKKIRQKMFFLRYKFSDSNDYLIVATTRLETIGSDVALAINPKDARFNQIRNSYFINPLTKKKIPLIESEDVDMDFGSGIMKVSAHSLIDLEIIKTNNLEVIETIDSSGLTFNFENKSFNNLTREDARKVFEDRLRSEDLIERIEWVNSNVGFSQRSDTMVEFLVKKQ